MILVISFFIIERFFLNNDALLTRFLEFQVVFIWFFSLYYSIKKFGLFSLYTLCLVGIFLFSVGAIFHFLISGDDIRHLERGFGYFCFSYHTIQLSLWIYSLFIFISFVTYSQLYNRSKRKFANIVSLQYNPLYFNIGKLLMLFFFAIQLYKGYLYFAAFSANRVEIFLYGNMANPVPSWLRFLSTFFEVGYYFILASIPNEKELKKYTLLYFVVIIPEIMLGNRSMFGAFILFYLWYNYVYYGKSVVKVNNAIILGLIMLVIFQVMEIMRDGGDFSLSSISLTKFLVSQGVSFYILPLYIDNIGQIQYYLYPFILYPILGGFSNYTGQSIEALNYKCGVGHQLMYTVNPNYYLSGASFGSSSIVEIYDTGVVGLFFFSIFFAYMLVFFEKKFRTNRFYCFACLFLVSHFVLSARGSYFPQIYGLVKLFIFYKFMLWGGKLFWGYGHKRIF